MFSVSGYQTNEQLYESAQSLIFRATRESDQRPVILKVLKDVHPAPERIARFKREHHLVHTLDLPGVVTAYDFLQTVNQWLFVQEDFGGESLSRLGLAGNIELDEFLRIGADIAGHVAAIHQQNIIHKDLNPANIVLNRTSEVVKVIDFGIATQLSRETVAFDHPSLVEGTPAYLSPEQTGRINQPLDYRTDLYSLGCTFYELLTGRPPFDTTELIELLHCHLARPPEPLSTRRSDLPPVITAIIGKLLAKNANDRYQSAHGLQTDLRRCHEAWCEDRSIMVFEPGIRDVTQRLAPPTRLYGRSVEIAQLTATFERVASGTTDFLLVSGDPGIGKSALVRELYQPVTAGRGFFVSGKFDQFQNDTPYQPILDALDRLIAQILMEPQDLMQKWSRVLQSAAGVMLPALVEILPRLQLLYDRLPPLPVLPTTEFDVRFTGALVGCIQAFASAEHPLILFIDDLQWADTASLELVRALLTTMAVPHLLLLGAYRHREVLAGHPLRALLKDVRATGAAIEELHLEPLNVTDTADLLADVLHCRPEAIREPAKIVHHKTDGNPFFIQTFLDTLKANEILYFEHDTHLWQWRTDQLQLLQLSDNVVELVIDNLKKLPESTRDLLTQAACIGNQFDLSLLAAVTNQTANEVAASLMPALTGSYLIPTNGDYRLFEANIEGLHEQLDVVYKFAHDRIQQAAYGLTKPGGHSVIHLRIGRSIRTLVDSTTEVHLLDMVNQLNQARELVVDDEERCQIAELNLRAGRKAKAAVAHDTALEYFRHGLAFLGKSPSPEPAGAGSELEQTATEYELVFRHDSELAMSLVEEVAEAAYMVADFGAATQYVDVLLSRTSRPLDRIKATQIKINSFAAQYDFSSSIDAAREILKPLGIELPTQTTESDVEAHFRMVEEEMGTRRPEDLLQLSEMTEEKPLATLRVLNSIFNPTFMAEPKLSLLVASQMVLMSLRHGLSEDSVHGFIHYGMSLCGRDKLALGYEYGCLAEILVERKQRKSQMPVLAGFGGAYIFHWKRHMSDAVPKMRDAYRAGLESGHVEMGVNCLQGSTALAYLAGHDLAQIDDEYTERGRTLRKHKQGPFLTWLRLYHQAVRNFRGLSESPTILKGDIYDEIKELPGHKETGDLTSIYMVDFSKMSLFYHFHEYQESLRCSRAEGNQPGSIYTAINSFYRCLAALALYPSASAEDQTLLLEEARPLIDKMKLWGESCPDNYGHKYHLMAAELHRVLGQIHEARDNYDLAADLARKHGYTQEEGLAFERAALFYLERDNPRLSGYYMRDAYHAFDRWGAVAKTSFLKKNYSYLLKHEPGTRSRTGESRTTVDKNTTSRYGELDLATVLTATRAIVKEIDITALLRTIIRVSLENAGAERGYLVMVRNGRLLVKARGELGNDESFELVSLALSDQPGIARSVVQYVARTAEPVLLDHAATDEMFANDEYISANACKSVLCLPVLNQGNLVAITYLENNRATAVFNEDRLDVLTLLMGQAAVSIENALLKEDEEVQELHFRVGGSLPADSPTYVRRQADALLANKIKQGEFCYVFNARQMGKSSLRIRTIAQLARSNVACASIDITAVGSQEVNTQQFYAGIARVLIAELGLQKDIKVRHWWREQEGLSPVQRLYVLIDEEILPRIDTAIVVFIDEVDAVLGLPFSGDDLFALIRMFYNRRAEDARYERLSFVLLGVASPIDLIRDKRRTPFNIGRAIPLSGLRFDEAKNLASGLSHVGEGQRLLRAVLDWTFGQPFLTQKICRLISEDESRPLPHKERDWVANLVRTHIIENWRHHDEPEHLATIEARILSTGDDRVTLLSRYGEILAHGEVDTDDSQVETTLLLSGLVVRTFDKIRVGNPIYAAVFDRAWIQNCLTINGA